MVTVKTSLVRSTPENILQNFFKAVEGRLKLHLWGAFFLMLPNLFLFIILSVLTWTNSERKIILAFYLLSAILVLAGLFFCFWNLILWKGARWVSRLMKSRYRTSYQEDQKLLRIFSWLLRSFFSHRTIKTALKAHRQLGLTLSQKSLIDYKRVNTPKIDFWLLKFFRGLGEILILIVVLIPLLITKFNSALGLFRPLNTSQLKQYFSILDQTFLQNLEARTIW